MFHDIAFPGPEQTESIVRVHHPGLEDTLLAAAVEAFYVLREAGLAGPGLGRFYLTAPALLVTSERDYDRYDVALSRYLSGLDPVGDDIADHVRDWLAHDPGALRLTPEQQARLDALYGEHIDPDEIRRRFEERLADQDEAHRGGSRHTGT